MTFEHWDETRTAYLERNWVRSLSDDVLLGFADREACYRELFRRYGAESYRDAMRLSEGRPEIGLEAFTWVWHRIRSGPAAHPAYQLGQPVAPFIRGLVTQAIYDFTVGSAA